MQRLNIRNFSYREICLQSGGRAEKEGGKGPKQLKKLLEMGRKERGATDEILLGLIDNVTNTYKTLCKDEK